MYLFVISKYFYTFVLMNYKDQIKATGVTCKKIAEKLGISNIMLSHYLNSRPMPEHIEKKLKAILKSYSSI